MKISKLKEAANQFGTPLYIYDLDIIKNQYIKLMESMKNLSNFKIYFAAKALSNISILKYFKKLGSGLETSSIEEVEIGLKCGFKKEEIIYSPNGVSLEELSNAQSLGVKINLDSIESIKDFTKKFKDQSISVRINPGIYAGGHEKISVGHKDSKFGIPENKLSELIRIEEKQSVIISGIHVHTGSDILKNKELELTVKKIFKIAKQFKNLKRINLGGGIKVPYFNGDSQTDLSEYSNVIFSELKKFELDTKKKIEIILEPGKFLTSESGFFITKVNYIKKSYKTKFAQIDTGFNHLIRPTLYNSYHEIVNLSSELNESEDYDIVGYICEKDTFAEKRSLKKLKNGDLICFKNSGAYCFSMSSNYNSRIKPAEVCLVNNEIKLIRKRETIKNILENQIDIFENNC